MKIHKDDDKTVKVIAGKFNKTEGPINKHNVEPLYFDIKINENKTFEFNLPESHNSFIYLISGEIKIDKNIVSKDSFFIYSNVDNIKLICSEESILFHISVPSKLNYETYYK